MSRWADRLQQVELLARCFQQAPLGRPYRPRLWALQPSSTWKLFPRQRPAIDFTRSCKEEVHVFALEQEQAAPGQRVYLVTSYTELWHYYRTYRQSLMHCYEVIPEGAVCKLYLDLEFHPASNPGCDGKAMVASLIQYVCEKLEEVYGIRCSEKHVLNLDSSTEDKFSRHLIFLLPNAAFKDNIHVGQFINAIVQPVLKTQRQGDVCQSGEGEAEDERRRAPVDSTPAEASGASQHAKRRRREETDLRFLLVKNKDGQDGTFVDLAVYTKNRNFRLYKSSKAGRTAAFTVAEDNRFTPQPKKKVSDEQSLFLASLISNVSFTGQKILTWDTPGALEEETVMPHAQKGPLSTSDSLGGYHCSPHREVDDFVLTVVQRDGIQGAIRRWNYFVSEQLLVYDILKYRWCQNVNRFHKSNNIMIVVDLKEEVWYQKCHDPACRNFRSSSYPLPQEMCVSYLMTMDEEDQAYLMDEAGNITDSQAGGPAAPGGPAPLCPGGEPAVWGDGPDDLAYAEALDHFERSTDWTEEVSDQLLLESTAVFDEQN